MMWTALLGLLLAWIGPGRGSDRVCPHLPTPSYCVLSTDYCASDKDCPFEFKCCDNGCNKLCAMAIPKKAINDTKLPEPGPEYLPRAGQCPRLPIPKYCHASQHGCVTDQQCPDPFKCCSNGCTKRCFLATQIKRPKGGPGPSSINIECPVFKKNPNCLSGFTNRCRDDGDCQNEGINMKCCFDGCRKLCLDPAEILLAKGGRTCPPLPRPPSCTSSQNDCLSDLECDEGSKCCSDGCKLKCVQLKRQASTPPPPPTTSSESLADAVVVVDDKCPFVTRPLSCPLRPYHQCYTIEECPENLRCCSDGCRNICLDPQARLLIKCPVVARPTNCPVRVAMECLSDVDCGTGNKCCYDGCTYKCHGKEMSLKGADQVSVQLAPFLSKAELVFILDTSTQDLTPQDFIRQKEFAKSVAHFFHLGQENVRTAIVSCNNTPILVKNLGQEGLDRHVDGLKQAGRQKLLHNAIRLVEENVLSSARPGVPSIVLIVSFGSPTSTEWSLLISRRGLRSMGAHVFVVGLGVHPAYTRLRRLVVAPGDLFTYPSADHLQSQGTIIARHISLRTSEVVPNDFKAELMFVLDATRYVGRKGLTQLKLFVLSLVRLLNLWPGMTRASVITYGDVIAPLSIRFLTGSDMNKFSDALSKLSFLGGSARLDSVFQTMEENLRFTREGVPKIAVMVTSGKHLPQGMDEVWPVLGKLREKGLWTNVVMLGDDETGRQDFLKIAERPEDVLTSPIGDLTSIIPRLLKHIIAGPLTPLSTRSPTTTTVPTTPVATSTYSIITTTGSSKAATEHRPVAKPSSSRKHQTTTQEMAAVQQTTEAPSTTAPPTTVEDKTREEATTKPTTTTRKTTIPTTTASETKPPTIRKTTTATTTQGRTTRKPTTTAEPPTTVDNLRRLSTKIKDSTSRPETSQTQTEAPGHSTAVYFPTTYETVAAGKVVKRPDAKSGYCPSLPREPRCSNRSRPKCLLDSECPGNQKCCSDGCTMICTNTDLDIVNAPVRGRRKPGICPVMSVSKAPCPTTNQCSQDSDCPGSQKCCRQHFANCLASQMLCIEPPSKVQEKQMLSRLYRPGNCPKLTRPAVCGEVMRTECNYDIDCAGTQKCCSNGCRRLCADAERATTTSTREEKDAEPAFQEGRCPPYSPVRACPLLVQDECTCDVDCAHKVGYKCCFDGCKRICRRPAGKVCSGKIDVVYLMDTSGSISQDDYRREKQFVKDLARIFRVGDEASHASAIIYNDDAHVQSKLGEHRSTEAFSKSVDAIPYLHGRTRIDRGLEEATKMFKSAREGVSKVLIVLTDGRQTPDPDAIPLDQASQPLKNDGVDIYAVGVGSKIDEKELHQIASKDSNVFTVDSFSALLGESQTIARRACDYVTGKVCVQGVDIGFIVDSSESITDEAFINEKNAVRAISEQFLIQPGQSRAGVVLYSGNPKLSISFDQYQSNGDFKSAVSRLQHLQSHTRLDKALRFAAANLFNNQRPGYPAVAIVMSDGRQTPGAESLSTAVQPLKELGVRVFAVGVGDRVVNDELKKLVQRDEDIYEVESFDKLIAEAKKFSKRACPAPIQPSPTDSQVTRENSPSTTRRPIITIPTSRPTRLSTPSTRRKTTRRASTIPPTSRPITTGVETTSLITEFPWPSPGHFKCSLFMDIIFVVDSSRSMDVRQYVIMKEFVKRLAVFLDVGKGSKAAVIIYSDDPILSIDFDDYPDQGSFLNAVDNLLYIMQRTRIDKALNMSAQVLKNARPGFPKAVIIMTDGRQTRDPDYVKLDLAAKPLHDAHARVLVIGIGPRISVDELMLMVQDPADVFTVRSFDSLVSAASSVAIKSCQNTVFPTRDPGPCTERFDLGFILDSSESILVSNHDQEKEFIKDIASNFVIGPQQVMLGLIGFSDTAEMHVRFASPASISQVAFEKAVDDAPYMKGRTRLDRALVKAVELVRGGRPYVPKVLVLLSDGRQSRDPGYTPLDQAIKPLIRENIAIRAVGIGKEIDERALQTLVSNRNDYIFRVGSFDALSKLHRSLSQSICSTVERRLLSDEPRQPGQW
ncbi:uncharacterized protein LOC116601510 isoform X2 [Nematostella vectensis]|uniref:uncharacterized protein LOC116601510 isoform X2 n=1 Tax=Nematostella vectensis TaxID=45351 RepID=UPI0020774276|nr:uncharacterized protein LOC116601510 isoform X2 [Nematostella vectensis]